MVGYMCIYTYPPNRERSLPLKRGRKWPHQNHYVIMDGLTSQRNISNNGVRIQGMQTHRKRMMGGLTSQKNIFNNGVRIQGMQRHKERMMGGLASEKNISNKAVRI
jgi:hypothetical protein